MQGTHVGTLSAFQVWELKRIAERGLERRLAGFAADGSKPACLLS